MSEAKKMIKGILNRTCIVATCMYCLLLIQMYQKNYVEVDRKTLSSVLIVAFITGLGDIMHYMLKEDASKKVVMSVHIIHFVYIVSVVLIAGAYFNWYAPESIGAVVTMIVTITIIYLINVSLSYRSSKATADKLNERLKHYKK